MANVGTAFAKSIVMEKQMVRFLKEYVKSMRLYYSFVTGIAGWIGITCYEYSAHLPLAGDGVCSLLAARKLIILVLAFLGWGINQIVNDYLGLPEDRINAPERPMVTGALNPRGALLFSAFLILASVVITWLCLEPVAIVFLLAGVMMNVLYEKAKGYGAWGNIVFGLMICTVTLFGFFAMGPVHGFLWLSHILPVLALLCTVNGLMTLYTYFKDYYGDRQAGKRTLIVIWGLKRSRILAFAGAFLPLSVFALLKTANGLPIHIGSEFMLLGTLALVLQIWTGALFYLRPVGKATYTSLGANFKACVCSEVALLSLFDPLLGVRLFVISYLAVTFLFFLHKNAKA
jgi:geranylgeranylglycerol-phosphate geranylgeranyltransferase